MIFRAAHLPSNYASSLTTIASKPAPTEAGADCIRAPLEVSERQTLLRGTESIEVEQGAAWAPIVSFHQARLQFPGQGWIVLVQTLDFTKLHICTAGKLGDMG